MKRWAGLASRMIGCANCNAVVRLSAIGKTITRVMGGGGPPMPGAHVSFTAPVRPPALPLLEQFAGRIAW